MGSAEEVPTLLSYVNTTNSTTISNMSQSDFVRLTINHQNFLITEHFITPEYVGITINDKVHILYPNESLLVSTTADDRYYLKLLSEHITPALDTIDIKLYVLPLELPNSLIIYGTTPSTNITLQANKITYVNLPTLDTLISLSSNRSSDFILGVDDITNTFQVPAPSGYVKYSVLNLSLANKSTEEPIAMQVITGYGCNASRITLPFTYANNTWTQVKHFSYNASACELEFTIIADPIVALLDKLLPGSPTESSPIVAASSFVEPGYYALPGSKPIYIANDSQFRNLIELGHVSGLLGANPMPDARIAFNNTLYNFYAFNGSEPSLSTRGIRLARGIPIRFAYGGFMGQSYYWWPAHGYISALPILNQTEFNEYDGAMRRNVR